MFNRMQQCLIITIPQSEHDIHNLYCIQHVTLKGEAPGGLDGLYMYVSADF